MRNRYHATVAAQYRQSTQCVESITPQNSQLINDGIGRQHKSLTIISLMVSVDIKHHVYFLPDKEELTNCFCTHTRTAQTEDLSLLSVNRKSASSLEYGAELAHVEDVTCVNCFFHEAAQS